MNFWIFTASLGGALGVILGAFGAHALRQTLSVESLGIYQTATTYMMTHSLALLGLGLWRKFQLSPSSLSWSAASAGFFLAGILIFSGSLYLLVFTGVNRWGMVTPLGGLCLILGWIFLGVSAYVA